MVNKFLQLREQILAWKKENYKSRIQYVFARGRRDSLYHMKTWPTRHTKLAEIQHTSAAAALFAQWERFKYQTTFRNF